MYMLDDFIEMGLEEGQIWPSDAHRTVAVNLAICNPMVKDRDTLTRVVQCILKVPDSIIKVITYNELVRDYNLPI